MKTYKFLCFTESGARYEFSERARDDLEAMELAKSWERNRGDMVEMFYPIEEVDGNA